MNVYEIVTQKIIDQLEKGTIPWRKPWNKTNCAVSWDNQRPYTGINAFILPQGEYATFNTISKNGGKVKKGEKSHIVVFWKMIPSEKTNPINNKIEKTTIPLLRYYNVFEINTQCEGLTSKRKAFDNIQHDKIQACEEIIIEYQNKPAIYNGNEAYYKPITDEVFVPDIDQYEVKEEYYSTLFHELAHSAGHKSRLNRKGITEASRFGSEAYSQEELVAEMTSAFLCGYAEIENHTLKNSANYIQSWIRKLQNKDSEKWLVYAASQAKKASNYILNIKEEKHTEEE